MSLWAWALKVWSRPAVERACLNLQDHADQCVALMLWGAWMLNDRRPMDQALAREAVSLARPIETEVLRPLRAARRALANAPSTIGEATIEEALQRIRTAELELERALLERLEALAPQRVEGADSDAALMLISLVQAWGDGPVDQSIFELVANAANALSGPHA